MLEGKPTPAGSGHAAPGYSYPGDLARFVRDRWRDVPEPPGDVDPLPVAEALEGFFAACYQASMLRGSVTVVISQDGGVRWVCQKGARVTYWEQE
jgi:hypothetical protein